MLSTCHDTNECEEIPNLCGVHGDCLNTPGYFECHCHTGFKIDDVGEVTRNSQRLQNNPPKYVLK